MKPICFAIVVGLLTICYRGEVMANEDTKPLGSDEIHIAPNGISMPIGRILLIGKGDFLAAVKFTKNEERENGTYSKYEYYEYSQGGGFKKLREGEVYLKKPKWWHIILNLFNRDYFRYGSSLKFGKFELFAHAEESHSVVYFGIRPNEADPEVRLAPTPWKEISQVVMDRRIKWYQYDESRGRKDVLIDKLWNK